MSLNTTFKFVVLFFSVLFLGTGLAQDAKQLTELSLEDLLNVEVTTASKKAEKTSDAPGVITTISSEEIKSFGANSLSDILDRATSIQILSVSVFPQNMSSIRGDLRSNQNNHVLLLVDGRPTREGINGGTDETFFATFPIEIIDKIEIIRGPGSVLYGSNAFNGVINIITKNESTSSIKVSAGAGSFGNVNGNVTGTVVSGDFSAVVGAKIENIDGWDFSAITKRPTFPDRSVNFKYGEKNLGLVGDFKFNNFRLLALYSTINNNMLGILPYASFVGKNKFSKLFLNLGYTYKISENWEASLNLTNNSNVLHIDEEALVNPDRHKSQDYLGEVTVNGTVSDKINIVFGGVFESRNKNENEQFSVVVPYHQKNLSGYFQGDYRPIEVLKLIAGGQINKPDGGKWDFVPRLGAIYDFTNEFGVKALYAQAFRAAYPLEQFIKNPTLIGNSSLQPEKIGTFDAQLFYTGKTAEISLTFFNSHYTNSITRVLTSNPGVLQFANKGELTVSGLELEGKTSVGGNFFVTGSATYNKNKEDVIVTPNFMAKLGVIYNTDFGIKLGLFNSYFGAPKKNTAPVVNPEATAVSLFSANISYKIPISIPLEVSLYAQNIFDVSYNFTEFNRNWINTIPVGPGRAIYGKVSLSL